MKLLATISMLALLAAPALATEDGKFWATATATRPSDGHRIIYRFVQEYQPAFDRSKYPVRVTVSWRYDSATGMPSVPERESMDGFEDRLAPHLEQSSLASLALVRTGDNLRQWTYYAKTEGAFRKEFDQTIGAKSLLPIEVKFELEPRWETYEQFVRGVRK